MTANFYKRILQGGVIASLATVFLVFPTLLFPYITSKQLVFNILTEALLLIWGVFIWKFPAYRPKKSLITWGTLAFFGALILSCFNSVDPVLSFWGDAERMLGVFHVTHFFFLYLIIISVFRTWADWKILFQSSIVIASFVSLRSIFGNEATKAATTIGNTAYVSGYLIFNLYFAALLFFKEKSRSWRWLYALPALIMLIAFNNARTSGAIIGLGTSILLVIFLVGVFHQSKKIKIAAWSGFLIALAAVIFIFSNTQADWFQRNERLRNLTTQKITFQTRLISWKAAVKDFPNHPVLGVGFGNYAAVFDKYFDAKFYDFTTSETYFDRAHNNIIEIASTTGLVGLVAYLSIFMAVAYYLFKLLRTDKHNLEPLVIIGLFAAYFIQNLAVFDSLVTYIGLMISLAYVYYLTNPGEERVSKNDNNLRIYIISAVALFSFILLISGSFAALISSFMLLLISVIAIYFYFGSEQAEGEEKKVPEFTALGILFVIFLLLTSRFNIAPWQSFADTITGYSQIAQGNVLEGVETYKRAFSHMTPLDRDSKTAFMNSIVANPNMVINLAPEKSKEVADFAISVAKDNLKYSNSDSLMYLQLAQMYSVGASLNIKDQVALNNYYQEALNAIDKAIMISPQRMPVYFMKANILISRAEYQEAIKTLNESVQFNPNFGEVYCHLYKTYDLAGDNKNAAANADKCVDLNALQSLGMSKSFLALMDSYYQKKDYTRTLIMAKQLVVFQPENPQAWGLLAQIYRESGDETNAALAEQKANSLQ